MTNFDAAQARHDANREPREAQRCAPDEHSYISDDGYVRNGTEIECGDCDSVVVVNLVEIE
jgi:hypothetical protein|tara:strand:- start:1627 stop:1809 length:183 start_codon:yes stop_codon:yes gene_type:complete